MVSWRQPVEMNPVNESEPEPDNAGHGRGRVHGLGAQSNWFPLSGSPDCEDAEASRSTPPATPSLQRAVPILVHFVPGVYRGEPAHLSWEAAIVEDRN